MHESVKFPFMKLTRLCIKMYTIPCMEFSFMKYIRNFIFMHKNEIFMPRFVHACDESCSKLSDDAHTPDAKWFT